MCVEAVICHVLHDNANSWSPECVTPAVRNIKVDINDSTLWRDPFDRAQGLRKLAIYQLGTASWTKEQHVKWNAFIDRINGGFFGYFARRRAQVRGAEALTRDEARALSREWLLDLVRLVEAAIEEIGSPGVDLWKRLEKGRA